METTSRSAELEPSGSQAVKALLRLREMVLAGELAAGSRIAEVAIADKLGVSRTPIRAALMRLEQEGLLELLPAGGYTVRTFTERDISEAKNTTTGPISFSGSPARFSGFDATTVSIKPGTSSTSLAKTCPSPVGAMALTRML